MAVVPSMPALGAFTLGVELFAAATQTCTLGVFPRADAPLTFMPEFVPFTEATLTYMAAVSAGSISSCNALIEG
eukprot:3546422-Rhodomonas_salina.1